MQIFEIPSPYVLVTDILVSGQKWLYDLDSIMSNLVLLAGWLWFVEEPSPGDTEWEQVLVEYLYEILS